MERSKKNEKTASDTRQKKKLNEATAKANEDVSKEYKPRNNNVKKTKLNG